MSEAVPMSLFWDFNNWSSVLSVAQAYLTGDPLMEILEYFCGSYFSNSGGLTYYISAGGIEGS